MARPKNVSSATVALDAFAFYKELLTFYQANKNLVRRSYKDLSKKFLDFNDPAKGTSFLRTPQFEALEIYIFLKEFVENQPLHKAFQAWKTKTGPFESRQSMDLFEQTAVYDPVFEQLRKQATRYPNYIFALTMGTGKTILMATCIFYEFLLANKFPKNPLFCHNALVFAPDKTVLQSLREIQTFDLAKVVPQEYRAFLAANVKFHFLDEAGMALSTTDGSMFNIVISNTQKVILKRQQKRVTATEKLFAATPEIHQSTGSAYDDLDDLYGEHIPQNEESLTTNQRFEKLKKLTQLGVYIDEAHHVFGTKLKDSITSLRTTVDELAGSLEKAGTHVVACFNYTGTPYVGQEVLPEVVYAYGLKEAIQQKYLKTVRISSYDNTRDQQFVSLAIADFLQQTEGLKPEGLVPKLAFFAASIAELQNELKPLVQAELDKHGISRDRVLVNVGDDKITKPEDLRDFNNLDVPGTAGSEKQFILLVNKGREGWNCRSLFGVGLFREPRSKIFVLQATMRCLRAIGDVQYTGQVYLTEANKTILDQELQQNFRITAKELEDETNPSGRIDVRPVPPPVVIKLKRIHRMFRLKELHPFEGLDLKLGEVDLERYRATVAITHGLPTNTTSKTTVQELEHRPQRYFSALTLVAEIARYINRPCLELHKLLENSSDGMVKTVDLVNQHNEVLYDQIIPLLFRELFNVTEYFNHEETEILLVKEPKLGSYTVTAKEDKIIRMGDVEEALRLKSFHLDAYAFDSNPELQVFKDLINLEEVEKLYFTGMLTHGQSDFFVQYIDPESNVVRNYYPDFLVQKTDGSYLIIEVKGDNKMDDPVVLAKQKYAAQVAAASQMTYHMVRSSLVGKGTHWTDMGFEQYQPTDHQAELYLNP